MVLLAITPAGLKDALRLAVDKSVSVWCGADAISEAEYAALDAPQISRFFYPLQGESRNLLDDALGTIREHHPGEVIWMEGE